MNLKYSKNPRLQNIAKYLPHHLVSNNNQRLLQMLMYHVYEGVGTMDGLSTAEALELIIAKIESPHVLVSRQNPFATIYTELTRKPSAGVNCREFVIEQCKRFCIGRLSTHGHSFHEFCRLIVVHLLPLDKYNPEIFSEFIRGGDYQARVLAPIIKELLKPEICSICDKTFSPCACHPKMG